MKPVMLVAAAAIVGISIGGVAVAGMVSMERSGASATTQSGDPMVVAKARFNRRCMRVTRGGAKNRQRCQCLADAVARNVYVPVEFELAGDLFGEILRRRSYAVKARMQAAVNRVAKRYKGKITRTRGAAIWRTVTRRGLACARSIPD